MQKKIIALAIASAFAAPALALADSANVTVYGQANVSYDVVNTGDTTVVGGGPTAGTSSNRVSSNSSRIGLKGSEDLGGGLSAIWQVETTVNLDNNAGGSTSTSTTTCAPIPGPLPATPSCTTTTTTTTTNNTLGDRDTFAGLSSASMGTVILGRHDTPYKMSTRKLDQFADSIADNRSLMGRGTAANFDARAEVVAYISPNINGFTGVVAYSNLAETNMVSTDVKATATSLAGMYDVAPFYASVAYETHNIAGGTSSTIGFGTPYATSISEKATKFGLGYTYAAFDLGFAYEKTSDDFGATVCGGTLGADCNGHNAYYLSGKYNVSSSDAVKAAYTKMGSTEAMKLAGLNDGAKQFSLGYDHSLSKRTTVYALYTSLKNDDNQGLGLSTAGTGGVNSVNNVGMTQGGASPHALSFGMKHSF